MEGMRSRGRWGGEGQPAPPAPQTGPESFSPQVPGSHSGQGPGPETNDGQHHRLSPACPGSEHLNCPGRGQDENECNRDKVLPMERIGSLSPRSTTGTPLQDSHGEGDARARKAFQPSLPEQDGSSPGAPWPPGHARPPFVACEGFPTPPPHPLSASLPHLFLQSNPSQRGTGLQSPLRWHGGPRFPSQDTPPRPSQPPSWIRCSLLRARGLRTSAQVQPPTCFAVTTAGNGCCI